MFQVRQKKKKKNPGKIFVKPVKLCFYSKYNPTFMTIGQSAYLDKHLQPKFRNNLTNSISQISRLNDHYMSFNLS